MVASIRAAFLVLGSVCAIAYAAPAIAATKPLVVTTSSGRHTFDVDVATSESERERGLMFRRSLPPDYGMFFVFDHSEPLMFWMKNTYVSLDIIFIASDGAVRNVAADATPLSEDLIRSAGPARYVLELSAGTAARIDLQPGDHVGMPGER